MIVPFLLLASGVFGLWRWHQNQKPALWTPERHAIYSTAMRYERDPKKLAHWADWFAKEGLHPQASALRARIQVPSIHGEGRTTRAEIVRRALRSRNHEAVRELAVGYEKQGYGATANALHGYARGLELSRNIRPVFGIGTVIPSQYVPPPPPPPDDGGVIPTTDPNNPYTVGQPGFGLGTIIPSQYAPPPQAPNIPPDDGPIPTTDPNDPYNPNNR
jgi:hypothetical protein